jgi:hypothetical protein
MTRSSSSSDFALCAFASSEAPTSSSADFITLIAGST